MTGIHRRLAGARDRSGLRRRDVAERFGISVAAVSSWEGKGSRPTLPELAKLPKLAELYGVSLEYLLGDGAAEQPTPDGGSAPELVSKSTLYVATGNRLRVLREALGYDSLRDFAAAIDVPEDRFGTYERGVSLLQMPTALLIKRRYGVTLEWIYDGDATGMPQGLREAISAILERKTASPPTSTESIARRLKLSREALGLNQTQFCSAAGVAPNTYNQWERARGRPELDGATQLCEAHGLTLDWIYRGLSGGLPDWLAYKMDLPPTHQG